MKYLHHSRAGLLLLLPMLLASCMLTGQTSPISILAPNVEPLQPEAEGSVEWSVQVQRPIADQMRDSDRLLVRLTPSRLQVYPGAAWLDSVPEMLQTMMIKQFADSERFGGVGRSGGMRTRYSLATEIRHFELVDQPGRLSVDIELQASLIHQRSARAVASRSFRHERSLAGTGVDPIVQAFELALGDLLAELQGWVLAEGQLADAERALQDEEPRRRWRPDG
jgi:cholesterol transport system auxiliary component